MEIHHPSQSLTLLCIVKEALAQAMKGDGQKLLTLMENELGAQEVLNEAMDEGIIGEGELDLGALRTLPA